MELVPILSTIILVGTIATFILAVAAYILYKIRERRARESQQQQGYYQQEPHVLVAPEGSQQPQVQLNQYQGQPQQASMYRPQPSQQPQQRQQLQSAPQGQNPNSLFWEYTDEGFVPVNPQEEQQQARRQQQEQQKQQQEQQQSSQDEGYAWL